MLQMVWPDIRLEVTVVYAILTVIALVLSRRRLGVAFRWLRA